MSKTDEQLKQDVEDELRWDPTINATGVAVQVLDGAVSLRGAVNSYADKRAAEQVGRRVGAVRVAVDELIVSVLNYHKHDDGEIADAALSALKWDVTVPKTVTAKVQAGYLTLEGRVDWNYQREAAERAVCNLEGVTGVRNTIKVKRVAHDAEVSAKVHAALQRQTSADFSAVRIDFVAGVLTLAGKVSSWHAIGDALATAWSAPGVTSVVQEMTVISPK